MRDRSTDDNSSKSIVGSLRSIAFLFAEIKRNIKRSHRSNCLPVSGLRVPPQIRRSFKGRSSYCPPPLPPFLITRILVWNATCGDADSRWVYVQQFIGYLTGWLSVIANRRSLGLIRLQANHWLNPIDYGWSAVSDYPVYTIYLFWCPRHLYKDKGIKRDINTRKIVEKTWLPYPYVVFSK